jgi:hypothetical protein
MVYRTYTPQPWKALRKRGSEVHLNGSAQGALAFDCEVKFEVADVGVGNGTKADKDGSRDTTKLL